MCLRPACANYYSKGAVDVQIAATVALPAIVGARAGLSRTKIAAGCPCIGLQWRQPPSHAHSFYRSALASEAAGPAICATSDPAGHWLRCRDQQHHRRTAAPRAWLRKLWPREFWARVRRAVIPHGRWWWAAGCLVPHCHNDAAASSDQGTAACGVVPGMLAAGAFPSFMQGASAACGAVTAGSAAGGVGAQVALGLSEDRLRQCYMVSLLLLGGRSFIAAGRNLQAIAARRAARK